MFERGADSRANNANRPGTKGSLRLQPIVTSIDEELDLGSRMHVASSGAPNPLFAPQPLQPRPSNLDLNALKLAAKQRVQETQASSLSDARSHPAVHEPAVSRLPSISDVGLDPPSPHDSAFPHQRTPSNTALVVASPPPLDNPPTSNPHVLRRLAAASPWAARVNVDTLSVEQLARCVDRVYVSSSSQSRLTAFRPRRTDVVVCGSVRSGQSAVLQALDNLRGSFSQDLSEATAWVENADTLNIEVPRLFKTHMRADRVLEAGDFACKVVVCVRDPADVAVSWFRHVRRLHSKLSHAKMPFDQRTNLQAFSRIALPELPGGFGATPEEHVAAGMRALESKSSHDVCIVFYEDLLENPRAVVQRLSDFTSWGRPRVDFTVGRLTRDRSFPRLGGKRGATGFGQSLLRVNGHSDVAREFAERWSTAMKGVRPSLTYDSLRVRFYGSLSQSGRGSFVLPSNKPGSFSSLSSLGESSPPPGAHAASRPFTTGQRAGSRTRAGSGGLFRRVGSFSFLTGTPALPAPEISATIVTRHKNVDPDDSFSESDDGSEGTEAEVVQYFAAPVERGHALAVGSAMSAKGIVHQVVKSKPKKHPQKKKKSLGVVLRG
jgi:hypothetical protein